MLSIIIPTLNEEKYLPLLLRSIQKQSINQELEIIVSDADSKDSTRKITQEFGCKTVRGGNMSQGRNNGAKSAKGDILLFADADTVFPPDFLKNVLEKFNKKKLDAASFFIYPIEKGGFKKFLFNAFHNYFILIIHRILPLGSMVFLVKKEIHNKIKGFDEEVVFLENSEYLRRIVKAGKYRILKNPYVFASIRRYRKDGWIKSGARIVIGNIYLIFFGPIKKDIFHYNFGHYDSENKKFLK